MWLQSDWKSFVLFFFFSFLDQNQYCWFSPFQYIVSIDIQSYLFCAFVFIYRNRFIFWTLNGTITIYFTILSQSGIAKGNPHSNISSCLREWHDLYGYILIRQLLSWLKCHITVTINTRELSRSSSLPMSSFLISKLTLGFRYAGSTLPFRRLAWRVWNYGWIVGTILGFHDNLLFEFPSYVKRRRCIDFFLHFPYYYIF